MAFNMEEDVKLAKWLNGELGGAELEQFEQTPEYATYSKIKEFSAQLTVPQADMDSLYNRIQQNKYNTTAQPEVRRLSTWLPRVAAVIALAFGAVYFLYTGQTSTQLADNGKRQTFLLPDNSQVVLNSGSVAKYKDWNWSNNRHIELKGEAYFKVAKGQKFDVVTPEGTVTVVGTQFNVKARNGRLDVVCYEGRVKVESNGQAILLTAGQSVSYANGHTIDLHGKPGQKPVWMSGSEVSFENETLEQVAAEIERQYNIKIEVNTKTARLYTGPVPTNDIETALGIIEAHWTLNAAKTGNNITLSGK
jgi:transmembrane sensor